MLQHDLDVARREASEATEKVKQLQEINLNYNSELKIQKRIQSKLKKELEVSDDKKRVADSESEAQKQRLEAV
jgi:hypothetical protein